MSGDVDALLAGIHHDPHSILGLHRENGDVLVRAWRPAAESVAVIAAGDRVELERRHPAGLFEGALDEPPEGYEVEAAYADGTVVAARDAYSFPPSLGDLDLHLFGEGRHENVHGALGARVTELEGVAGTAFAVWAPNARGVGVVGDFNFWNPLAHPMRSLGGAGVWELFVPGLDDGERYKYALRHPDGSVQVRADPFARRSEEPPATASVVFRSRHEWQDDEWLERRAQSDALREPMSVYEVHLGSWRLNPLEGNRPLTYAELADELGEYVADLGFTHVELLPVMQHPFSGSWGYQVTGYFAPQSTFGSPDDFRAFVDRLHARGIGVLLDWVPAHFPRDAWALARFDGTALYEHDDPRRGAHPDWGTLVFNLGRTEVRNFLLSNALYWTRDLHVDGLRVDAVASMLYLDYSRQPGEWVPNVHGGNEDLDAVSFLQELNELLYARVPGVVMAAEESTAWPGVSRPTYVGGLGFGFKWNMGWMHDTLAYFANDPVYRRYHHHQLTFSLMYAFSENFVLPLSHDEVVHGKGSLLQKMPGDRWQQFANLRALYGYMWAHPGKKLLFMGGELAQEAEWAWERSLDWHLLERADHGGVQALVRDLNRAYREEPALWEVDFSPAGFRWLEPNDAANNVLAFLRLGADDSRGLACVCNLAPVPRYGYRLGLPAGGRWRELLNTDSPFYGGGGVGNLGAVEAEAVPWHEQPFSAEITLPPLGVCWLVPE